MKKILAVLLAAIMLLSVMPFAFAEDTNEADATVAEWKTNNAVLVEKLFDELTYAHYQYVIDNNKTIKQKMDVMTAFGLYDDAWINYATKNVNVDTCKTILLSLIEAYQADFGKDYVEADISAQHFWVYKNGECVMDDDFVSGTETNSERRTPRGVCQILSKNRNVTLGTYATDCYYKAELSLRTDRWTDQQGCTRYGTRAYINRLSIL